MSDLINLIKQISLETITAGKPFTAITGVVTSVSPLEVAIHQNLTITENFLALTNAVRDYKTKITFDNPDIKQVVTNWDIEEKQEGSKYKMTFKEPVEHDITVHNALTVGEAVILLRQQGGQKFIVLDRVVV
ncbi:MAG: DUF2577 domain-containing protein [Anaerotignaceae bacterium]